MSSSYSSELQHSLLLVFASYAIRFQVPPHLLVSTTLGYNMTKPRWNNLLLFFCGKINKGSVQSSLMVLSWHIRIFVFTATYIASYIASLMPVEVSDLARYSCTSPTPAKDRPLLTKHQQFLITWHWLLNSQAQCRPSCFPSPGSPLFSANLSRFISNTIIRSYQRSFQNARSSGRRYYWPLIGPLCPAELIAFSYHT